jgi:hypothetical protein
LEWPKEIVQSRSSRSIASVPIDDVSASCSVEHGGYKAWSLPGWSAVGSSPALAGWEGESRTFIYSDKHEPWDYPELIDFLTNH